MIGKLLSIMTIIELGSLYEKDVRRSINRLNGILDIIYPIIYSNREIGLLEFRIMA